MVFALHEALTDAGGIWVGAGTPGETAEDGLTPLASGDYERMTFELTKQEHRGFYLGYSNGVLWPLFHHRADLLDIQEGEFDAYAVVNARVARSLAAILRPDDMVWIHDYHFLMVASELRKLGVTNRIGLFLHIPIPTVNDVMALPESKQVAGWFAAHDLVGLQTRRDVAAAFDILRHDDRTQLLNDGTWVREGRAFKVLSFPIGIDAKAFAETAERSVVPQLLLDRRAPLLIGVDRLDYSKGLVHRFQAFGEYLHRREDLSIRPTFLQIAPVSREDVSAYQEIREELERTSGSINGAHADLDWTPIRYIRRHIDRDRIAALYRRADVAMVTPLADGMNLVAKEFVAAQDPEDPGVLILSVFAGAAEQMQEALMINPHDQASGAEAIATALAMPLEERKRRHEALREGVFAEDVAWWTRSYLAELRRSSRSLDMSGLDSVEGSIGT
ncbi:trehalose-6-phosphate synthase [Jannaschia formosa]|nr:trehalose-6-phosphate synthase [Jannaschia formosa]